MTASGWLAIGAVVAAMLGPGIDPAAIALAAGAIGTGAWASRTNGVASRRAVAIARTVGVGAVGAIAIALRLVGSQPASVATPALPEGRGPWSAIVDTISPVRDAQQVAILVLSSPALRVATTLPRYPEIQPGLAVVVDGAIEPPPEGPYGDYLRRIGVAGTLRSRTLAIREDGSAGQPPLERLRRAAGDALAAAIPEPEAGLAAGIVVGLREQVDRDLAADFTTVGASHIVAISGWNIAIVATTVGACAGRMGRRRRTILLAIAIVAYVAFAGASPSVVRAAAMAGVVLVARETGRAGRAAAALGWAAALLLLVDPSLVGDAGFQLSTLATAGILAWATPLSEAIDRSGAGRVPRWLAETLAVSLAAQAATLPIVLLTFGRLAIVSPIVNLIVVPLVAPAMAACALALGAGAIASLGAPTIVGSLGGLPAWALLTTICTVIRAAAGLPIASVTIPPPWTLAAAAIAAALPFLVIVAARRRRGRPRPGATTVPPAALASRRPGRAERATSPRLVRVTVIALVVGSGGLLLAIAHRPAGAARITVLDIGQGDSILVEGGRGSRMLVDGGPDPDRLLVELDRRVPPWDRRIDLLVLTHPHEDHVAGLALLLGRYRIGRVYEGGMHGPGPGYAAWAARLAGASAPARAILSTGARIDLDDIGLKVLWPDPGTVPVEPPDGGRGINDVSIVLLGEVAGRRFLLTGDVEDDVDPLLEARGLPPIDILKVAHHGSGTASTTAFLGIVRPGLAIVSSGAGNPYGHPAKTTLDHLRSAGARVLRTDTDGSVDVTIDASGGIGVSTAGARRTTAVERAATRLAAVGPVRPPPAFAFGCGIPSTG